MSRTSAIVGTDEEPRAAMTIRPADVAAIAAIYAHHVLHGTGTFEEVPPDEIEMAARFGHVTGRGWPWLVAEADGAMPGFAYAGIFRDRSAYRYACEDSVYVHPDAIGRGIGTALLEALMIAAAAGFRRMLAVIGDSANTGSIALHRRHGFTEAGVLRDVGFKFDRWLDVVFVQRTLAVDGDRDGGV